MASSVDLLLVLFLLFLTSSSVRTYARESQFFSKASRSDTSPKEATPVPEKTPAVQNEEPVALPPQSHNGYGLYGHGANQFPPTTTNYNYNNNYARRDSNNIPSSFTNAEFSSENYENKASNARLSNEEFGHGSYNTNGRGGYNSKDPNYSYYNKQYGMSDTRFMENGKYFYDVNAEGNGKEYEQMKRNPEGYGSYRGVGERGGSYGNGGYSYGTGNYRNGYEYENEMEGYQNSQEKQEYVP